MKNDMNNYRFPNVLNTINIKYNDAKYLHVVSDTLSVGDVVGDECLNGLEVVEIIEQRKARGTWKGVNPNWYKVTFKR